MQSIYENQLSENDCCSLKIDCLPAVVVQILDVEKSGLKVGSNLRHGPLKVGKKWRIVESPF